MEKEILKLIEKLYDNLNKSSKSDHEVNIIREQLIILWQEYNNCKGKND